MSDDLFPKDKKDNAHQYDFERLNADQILVLVSEAAVALDWLSYITENGYIIEPNNQDSNKNITISIENNIATLKCTETNPENESNIHSFIQKINEYKALFSEEDYLQKAKQYRDILKTNEENDNPPWYIIFIPQKDYFVTPILININLIIYLLMGISGAGFWSPESEALVKWGANYSPYTINGDYWRLITSCFVHIGPIHLLYNMYALLLIGPFLEALIGAKKYLFAYLLTSITASLNSLWWNTGTTCAGASGAIFGIYGVFFAFLTVNYKNEEYKSLLKFITIFIIFNLIAGTEDGVDNAAHIGGLISGLIIGYAFLISTKKPNSVILKYFIAMTLTAIVGITAYFEVYKLKEDSNKYDKLMAGFSKNELKALEIYDVPDSISVDKYLYTVNDNDIDNWKKNIPILDTIDKLKIPKYLIENSQLLREYCNLRIKSYEYISIIQENDEQKYRDSISVYDERLIKIMKQNSGETEEQKEE